MLWEGSLLMCCQPPVAPTSLFTKHWFSKISKYMDRNQYCAHSSDLYCILLSFTSIFVTAQRVRERYTDRDFMQCLFGIQKRDVKPIP